MTQTMKFHYYFIIIGASLLFFSSCEKDDDEGNKQQTLAILSTTEVTGLTQTTAISGGEISDDGGATVTARGIVWGINESPTIVDGGNIGKTRDGAGSGVFSSKVLDLEANTKYYVRSYATNSLGTTYGSSVSFTTLGVEDPIVLTTKVTEITQTSAKSGGEINFDGGSSIIVCGIVWGINKSPTIKDGENIGKTEENNQIGNFISSMTNLEHSTTYYVRAYATNSKGTSYGDAVSFTTVEASKIVLTTTDVVGITETAARTGGAVISEGESEITARGVVWSTKENPTINDNKTQDGVGLGEFTSTLFGLNPSTKYYVRAYATNNEGTEYGNFLTFSTLEKEIAGAIDIDGNEYRTVRIGDLEWFAENLRTTKLNDGSALDYKEVGSEWIAIGNDGVPAYAAFENNAGDYAGWSDVYGYLYNGYAVDSEKLCPEGWRVPNDGDWNALIELAGGATVAGGVLKSTHTDPDYFHPRWNAPNIGATDNYGFSAFPSGHRSSGEGGPYQNSNRAFFVSSTSIDSWGSMCYRMDDTSAAVTIIDWYSKRTGFAVRCVRD